MSSDFKGLESSREYRFKEWLRYTRTRPYVCQPLMKNFWQCFDHHHFVMKEDAGDAKSKCLEKFNYEECFKENSSLLKENWAKNVQIYSAAGGDEEEEEE